MQPQLSPYLLERFPMWFQPKSVMIVDDKSHKDFKGGWFKDELAEACRRVGHKVVLVTHNLQEAMEFARARRDIHMADVAFLDQVIFETPRANPNARISEGGLQIAQELLDWDPTIGIFSVSTDYWDDNIRTPIDQWDKRFRPHPRDLNTKSHWESEQGPIITYKYNERGWGPLRGPDLHMINRDIGLNAPLLAELAGRWRYTGFNTETLLEIERDYTYRMSPEGKAFYGGKERRNR